MHLSSSHHSQAIYRFLLILTFSCSIFKISAQNKTLGLTKHLSGGAEDGFVLFSPLGSDTTYLINKCGQRVHSWYSEYTPGLSVYLLPNGHLLKTGTYTDSVFGFAGGRGGIIEEYDWDGNIVWRYKLFNDSLCQHHDITPMPNGNVLVLSWHSISKLEAMALGRKSQNFGTNQNDLWGERILELKPKGKDSAEIVWEWDLYDHIIQDADSTKLNYGIVFQKPERMDINYALDLKTNDWIHANSLDYNEKLNQIVMSCHNISEIWILDHSTTKQESKSHSGGLYGKGGDLLYRWGNPQAYNYGAAQDRKLFRQHNAQWIKGGLQDSGSIMIFNNGWNRDTAYSSIDIIKTPVQSDGSYSGNLPYGPSKQSWIYKDSIPTKFYSNIISGTQRLPNGNTLICSGVQGRFFEITPQKKTVWEYRNPVNGNSIQADGENPKDNMVFRCVFYPNTYSAFKNRTITSKGTIELNSYVYSCTHEFNPPQSVNLLPLKDALGVNPNAPLKITFSEAVLAKSGFISIYQNNQLFETVSVTGNLVKISNETVTINHIKAFDLNAKISVFVPKNCFRDSSNNLSNSIDTSSWRFNIAKTKPIVTKLTPARDSKNVSINALLQIQFKENVFKATVGEIIIWENSLMKEKILIASNRISIFENVVSIAPGSPFALNANIVIEFGNCFIDSHGIFNDPVTFGEWNFSTVTSPKVVNLSPANKATNVSKNSTLSIGFDRPVRVYNPGYLMVYENNLLIDSIKVNGPRAMISGNFINFDLNADFAFSSHVAILLKTNVLMDTFNTPFIGIDSTDWNFTVTAPGSNIRKSNPVEGFIVYPNPVNGNFILTSLNKIETIEVLAFTGQKTDFSMTPINDKSVAVELKNVAPGHYLILINGSHSTIIQVQ